MRAALAFEEGACTGQHEQQDHGRSQEKQQQLTEADTACVLALGAEEVTQRREGEPPAFPAVKQVQG